MTRTKPEIPMSICEMCGGDGENVALGGKGLAKCRYCSGTGQVPDLDAIKQYIAGAEVECKNCEGLGHSKQRPRLVCGFCKETGTLPMFLTLRKPCSCANSLDKPTLCGYCSTQPVGTEGTWIRAHSGECPHFCQGRKWLINMDDMSKVMMALKEEGVEIKSGWCPEQTQGKWNCFEVYVHRQIGMGKFFKYVHPDPTKALLCALYLAVKEMESLSTT